MLAKGRRSDETLQCFLVKVLDLSLFFFFYSIKSGLLWLLNLYVAFLLNANDYALF